MAVRSVASPRSSTLGGIRKSPAEWLRYHCPRGSWTVPPPTSPAASSARSTAQLELVPTTPQSLPTRQKSPTSKMAWPKTARLLPRTSTSRSRGTAGAVNETSGIQPAAAASPPPCSSASKAPGASVMGKVACHAEALEATTGAPHCCEPMCRRCRVGSEAPIASARPKTRSWPPTLAATPRSPCHHQISGALSHSSLDPSTVTPQESDDTAAGRMNERATSDT